jgi:peptidoglycan/LPS O-acetylase OafA/YrhL
MSLSNTPESAPAVAPAALAGSRGEVAPRRQLGYRPELDGLRGVAVLLVVAYHVGAMLWPSAGRWFPRGGALGVDLFFVLSGFLITSLLVGESGLRGRVDARAFARRRAARLVPAMVTLFTVVLVVAALGYRRYGVGDVLSTAGWSLTFTANWAMVDGRPNMMGHLWSVAIEGQFYLLWATVVVVALRMHRGLGVLAGGAATAVLAVVWWRRTQAGDGSDVGQLYRLYLGTGSRLDAPLVGALAGLAFAAGRFDRLRGRAAAAVGGVGMVALFVAAATIGPVDFPLYRGLYTAVALACAAAVVGAVCTSGESVLGAVLRARPLVYAGVVSYSLYLWHLPIFEWLADAAPGWSPPIRAVVGLVAAAAAASLSYAVIERRFLRRRQRAPAAVPAGAGQPDVPMAKQRSSSSPNA